MRGRDVNPQRSLQRLFLAPTGTESTELLLASWLLVRGVSTLLFDGLSGPGGASMYRYALNLAPEWVWGAIPAVIGALWLGPLLYSGRSRRTVVLVAVQWFMVWAALLVAGCPTVQVLAYVGPLLVMALGAAWAWWVLGWTQRGSR